MRAKTALIALAVVVSGAVSGYAWQEKSGQIAASKAAASFIDAFASAPYEKRQQVVDYFAPLVSYGDMLQGIQTKYPTCHSEAHPVGQMIFRRSNDLGESLRICKNSCGDGCFHGVLMEMFSTTNDYFNGLDGGSPSSTLSAIASKGEELCAGKEVSGGFSARQCFHGMGHVMLYVADYDIARAIRGCSLLDVEHRVNCRSGAFMEFVISSRSEEKINSSTYYPCDLYPQYALTCYYSRSNSMVRNLGVAGASEACRALPTQPERNACLQGLGGGIFYWDPAVLRENGALERACAMDSDAEEKLCVEGALIRISLTLDYKSDKSCDILASDYRQRCTELLREIRNPAK